jgi:hypothetical protein
MCGLETTVVVHSSCVDVYHLQDMVQGESEKSSSFNIAKHYYTLTFDEILLKLLYKIIVYIYAEYSLQNYMCGLWKPWLLWTVDVCMCSVDVYHPHDMVQEKSEKSSRFNI